MIGELRYAPIVTNGKSGENERVALSASREKRGEVEAIVCLCYRLRCLALARSLDAATGAALVRRRALSCLSRDASERRAKVSSRERKGASGTALFSTSLAFDCVRRRGQIERENGPQIRVFFHFRYRALVVRKGGGKKGDFRTTPSSAAWPWLPWQRPWPAAGGGRRPPRRRRWPRAPRRRRRRRSSAGKAETPRRRSAAPRPSSLSGRTRPWPSASRPGRRGHGRQPSLRGSPLVSRVFFFEREGGGRKREEGGGEFSEVEEFPPPPFQQQPPPPPPWRRAEAAGGLAASTSMPRRSSESKASRQRRKRAPPLPPPPSLACHVLGPCVGPGPQQRPAELGVARERGPVQRRPPRPRLARSRVCAGGQQRPGDVCLPADDGAGEGRGGGGGAVLDDGLGLKLRVGVFIFVFFGEGGSRRPRLRERPREVDVFSLPSIASPRR